MAETTAYSPYLPLLVGVGPVLLIALLWRHDPDALFLLLMALSPQRFFYDQLPLWLIPKRRPEFVATMFLSWGALAYRFFTDNPTAMQAGAWSTLWIYMPMLMILVTRRLTLRWESSFVLDGAYTDGGSGGRGICPVPANSGR